MHRIAFVALFVALLTLALVSPGARGQTTTSPTSTATAGPVASPAATSIPPTAKQLLARMQKAIKRAGSAHLKAHLSDKITGPDAGTLTGGLTGDVAWRKPERGKLVGTVGFQTTSGGSSFSFSTRLSLLYAHGQLAVRIQGEKWDCTSFSSLLKTTVPTGGVSTPTSVSQLKGPVLIGPGTLAGVAVWHLQERGTIVTKTSKKHTNRTPMVVDLFVSQADDTLLRATVLARSRSGKDVVTESGTVDLSKYGEPVTVTLPKACTGKRGKGKSDQLLLGRSLPMLFGPSGALAQLSTLTGRAL